MKRVIMFLSAFCLLGASQAFAQEQPPPAAVDDAMAGVVAEKKPVVRKMQSRQYKGDLPLADADQASSAPDGTASNDAPARAERAPETKSAAARYEEDAKNAPEDAIWEKYKALVGSVKPQEDAQNAPQEQKSVSAAAKLRAQEQSSLSDEQRLNTPSAKKKEEPAKAAQAPSGNPIADILRQYTDRTKTAPRMGVRSFGGGEEKVKKDEAADNESEESEDSAEKPAQ